MVQKHHAVNVLLKMIVCITFVKYVLALN